MNAVAHWFTYRGSSAQIDDRLALVADLRRAPETLLRGELTSPRLTGLGLTALHRVVSTAFYDPTRGGMHGRCDPIVTSDSDQARFEGFSLCCGS